MVSVNTSDDADISVPTQHLLTTRNTLRRELSFFRCFVSVVSTLIGSGVYVSPALVARYVPNMSIGLVVWIAAGIIALLGALCYTELVSVFKKTGSSYIFVYECYGKVAGFFVIWINAIIMAPTAISVISYTFGLYATAPFFTNTGSNTHVWVAKGVGLAMLYIITVITIFGVKTSAKFSTIINIIQMLSLSLIIVFGIYYAVVHAGAPNLQPSVMFNNTWTGIKEHGDEVGTAMFNALWCFDGWYMITTFVEEVRNPEKTVPLLACTSIPFVTLIYVIVNIACLTVLTQHKMASSVVVFQTFSEQIIGKYSSYIIPPLVSVSCIATFLGTIQVLSRFMLSAAREKQMPSLIGLIHRKWRTPIPATLFIVFMGTITTLMAESLEQVMLYCNIAIWIEYGLAISSVIAYRYKYPDKPRSYRVWITTPIIMVFVSVALIGACMYRSPVGCTAVILVSLTGLPVYYICIYKQWLSILQLEKLTNYFRKNWSLVTCEVNGVDNDSYSAI